MKIIAIREKFEHISSHGGYDRLYEYLSSDVEIESIFCNFKKKYPRGIGRAMILGSKFGSGTSFYNAQSFEAEAKAILMNIFNSAALIHYSHGEPYFGLGSKFKRIVSSKIVLTNHQPVSWWEKEKTSVSKFEKADSVIALSEYDKEYFSSVSKCNVVYIPHGVDTDFFAPPNQKNTNNKFKVLFSGRYLRDINTLTKLVKRVGRHKDIEFVIIYFDKTKVDNKELSEISEYPNVHWLSNLSEIEYLNEYQNADCCLIPLLDSTANNAILEAMSCGLPIISTNLPALKSYLREDYSILTSMYNVDDLYEALLNLYSNRELCLKMGKTARSIAEREFDWRVIAKKTTEHFKSVL